MYRDGSIIIHWLIKDKVRQSLRIRYCFTHAPPETIKLRFRIMQARWLAQWREQARAKRATTDSESVIQYQGETDSSAA